MFMIPRTFSVPKPKIYKTCQIRVSLLNGEKHEQVSWRTFGYPEQIPVNQFREGIYSMVHMPMSPLPGVLSSRRRFLFRRATMGVELLKKGIVFNEIDYLHRSHFLHFNPRRADEKK